MISFKIIGKLEGLTLAAIAGHFQPHHQIEVITDMTSDTTYLIVNSVTGKATVKAPTAELIEHVFNYTDNYFKKRGPEQVVCEFPAVMGITLDNFHTLPKSLIWDGVANYAKRKAG